MAYLLLVGSVLARLASANYLPNLIPRQTDEPSLDDAGECLGDLLSVVGDAPLPPQDIIDVMTNFFMTATGTYDAVCGWQTNIPESLVGDWYSYQGEVMSWYSDNSERVSSALAGCPDDYGSSAGPCTQTIPGLPPPGVATATAGNGGERKSNDGQGRSVYLIPTVVMGLGVVAAAALLL